MMHHKTLSLWILILFTSISLSHAQGVPGVTRARKSYRTTFLAGTVTNGVNMNLGTPRFFTTSLPADDTNGTTIVSFSTYTYTSNLNLTIAGTAGAIIPFEFENPGDNTISDITLNLVMVGQAVPAYNVSLTPPAGAGLAVYTYSSSSSSNPQSGTYTANITFSRLGATNSCATIFTRYRVFTNDFTQTVTPCVSNVFSTASGRPIAGGWSLSIFDTTGSFSPFLTLPHPPIELQSFTVTASSKEPAFITFGGRIIDIRTRAIRAGDFTAFDPTFGLPTGSGFPSGRTFVKQKRSISER